MKYGIPTGLTLSLALWAGCSAEDQEAVTTTEQAYTPSVDQVPLDPLTIPKFAQELAIPRVFAPTVITENGQVVRHEYTVSVARAQVQMLPSGFPPTTVLAYGGQVKTPGGGSEFTRTVPGPVFDNIKGIPSLVRWRNEIFQPHFMPVDPTLHWANPERVEPPLPPYVPFPPGYPETLYPVPQVTHNHGLVVEKEMDGIAEQWFTPFHHRGPDFHTRDYLKPNEQPSTQLFYHDHTMGITRLNTAAGLVGTAYFIRDPQEPLDQASSPLPQGEYEIPLVLFGRGFFTDGELNFPRSGNNTNMPYFTGGDGANTILVNGKVWPNLNVERRQYRFRTLAADRGIVFNITLDNNGTTVPFTIIGSDGGYLPAPQVVNNVQLGITERADLLVDFSQFAPGTQITMLNAGANPDTTGTIMRFTVQDTPAVTPPPLPEVLVPRATLTPDAPKKQKVLINVPDGRGNASFLVDGQHFTSPTTDFVLNGSTEQWDFIQASGANHQMHLHLLQFQVLERQPINAAAYNRQWWLINGYKPRARPIHVDPTPFFTGPAVPPFPYETGWKDTVRAPGNQVTRIVARWAPQEVPTGGATPGVNQWPVDPVAGDGYGYMMHCHVLNHEDNEMMRKLPVVNAWASGVNYEVGTVIDHQGINYRVRLAHTSSAAEPPSSRFDLWDRVNNNDGTWQPQIVYDVDDRVLHEGELYIALGLHQAQPGQTPANTPALWHILPQTACGQLAEFCHDHGGDPAIEACHDLGHAGDENACLAQIQNCVAVCTNHSHDPRHIHSAANPCHGLCEDPVAFEVPDHQNFQSGNLGTGAGCFSTHSKLRSGTCNNFSGGRQLTVNGRVMPCDAGNWAEPLPTERNEGYCIQVDAGGPAWSSFATW